MMCDASVEQSFKRQFELPGGATVNPRGPARSIAFCTRPDAFACSTNSVDISKPRRVPFQNDDPVKVRSIVIFKHS